MRSIGLASALLISMIFILVVWLVGRAAGIQVSLLGSIGLTVLLTILLNLVVSVRARHQRA
jgi:hypothetical protein